MIKCEKAYIYFDTNSLECRHSGKSMFLSKISVSSTYYEIERIIKNLGIGQNVRICIPEITWMEFQEHMYSCYKSEKDALISKVACWKKTFGDLADISYNLKGINEEIEYKKFLLEISQEFFENPKITASIIPCPKDEKTIEQIIKKAMRTISPFTKTKINGKEYTDAGFKDALIYETVLQHTGNDLGIFITSDNDFLQSFSVERFENLRLCSDVESVRKLLIENFDIAIEKDMEDRLRGNDYLLKRVLSDTGLDESSQYIFEKVKNLEDTLGGTKVEFLMLVNGIRYTFEILYDINASEITESYILQEGDECDE